MTRATSMIHGGLGRALAILLVLAVPMLLSACGNAPKLGKPAETADKSAGSPPLEDRMRSEEEDMMRQPAPRPPPAASAPQQRPPTAAAPQPRPRMAERPPAAEPPSGGSAPPPPVATAPAPPPPPLTRGFGRSSPSAGTSGGAAAPAPAPSAPGPKDGVTKPGTATVEEQADWDVVPVFFGTDRARTTGVTPISYGSDRARKLDLGRALVTVPKTHQVPNIERPWALKIPYFQVKVYEQKEDPKQHFTMKEIQALTREQFLAYVRERLATSARYKDHAVIFVHGYNTAFDSAIYRTAQMAYDLKFDGAAFLYSWPSGGTFESYTYDRESSGQSQPFMRDFLDLVIKESGAKSVSIIAHSMGNQPVLQILRDLRHSKPDSVVISQIILAAPDVDRDNFENIAKEIKGMASGVTLYAAGNDRALKASRRFNGGIPRAGDVPDGGPLVVPGIDTIDVTSAGMEGLYLNHSGYAENQALLSDIGLIIQTGERPPDKRFPILQKMTTTHGDYWKYPPRR